MRNIVFTILLFGSLSIICTGQTGISAPNTQKTTIQTFNDNQPLSPELIAVIFGAISAGFITLIIKLGEWYFGRRMLMNNLKKGLYFEIENHKIIELDKEEDNQPNFALSNFNDIFYHGNLSNITKVLDEDLVQRLTFYYLHLKLANDLQNKLFKLNEKLEEMHNIRTVGDEMKVLQLSEKKNDLKDSIRLILATAQFIRLNLLTDLKKIFKQDPSKLTFIDVLPKYQEWFKKVQKNGQ